MVADLEAQSIAEALHLLRNRAKLTRDQLAALSGVPVGTLTRYERGETARLDIGTLRAVVLALCSSLGLQAATVWDAFGALAYEEATAMLEAEIDTLVQD